MATEYLRTLREFENQLRWAKRKLGDAKKPTSEQLKAARTARYRFERDICTMGEIMRGLAYMATYPGNQTHMSRVGSATRKDIATVAARIEASLNAWDESTVGDYEYRVHMVRHTERLITERKAEESQ